MHQLDNAISSYHLLKHPFYQRWMAGSLSGNELKNYVKNYFGHVLAFPQYVSAVHSRCDDENTRKALLDNLIEEEHGEENHPELWLRFGESLGLDREQIRSHQNLKEAKGLVATFKSLTQKSFPSGLGALYAYESQVPAIAEQKIDGLKKHYNVTEPRGLAFFQVHLTADQYHSESERNAFDNLSNAEKEEAIESAQTASKALWNFLSALDRDAGIDTANLSVDES